MSIEVKICVFGSSSQKTSTNIINAAHKVGELIAESGSLCVTGGGMWGVMGAVCKGAAAANGKLLGIIHESFQVDGGQHAHIEDMIVSKGDNLEERKMLLFDHSNSFIVMPGGIGTLDELYDFMSHKSLKMKNLMGKPICLLNLDGFFDGTIAQLKRAEKEGLLYQPAEKYVHVCTTPEEAVAWCCAEVQATSNGMPPLPVREKLSDDKLPQQTEQARYSAEFWTGFATCSATIVVLSAIVGACSFMKRGSVSTIDLLLLAFYFQTTVLLPRTPTIPITVVIKTNNSYITNEQTSTLISQKITKHVPMYTQNITDQHNECVNAIVSTQSGFSPARLDTPMIVN